MLLVMLSKKLEMEGAVETAHIIDEEEGDELADDETRHDNGVCGLLVEGMLRDGVCRQSTLSNLKRPQSVDHRAPPDQAQGKNSPLAKMMDRAATDDRQIWIAAP